MADEVEYLSQGVNYLGFLQTQLRDLQGMATLAYELIQNADDVRTEEGQPGASRITFDIREDALIVENDGVFRERDFERIRDIASGGKREEQGTTGAFGIGFISVYQITDAPEILSNGTHYRIRPEQQENRRIEKRGTDVVETQFRLPWATDPESKVRQGLRLDAVKLSHLDDFEQEISKALSAGSLFLKQLKTLELKRNGLLVKSISREFDDDQLLIQEDELQPTYWKILRGNFDKQAKALKAQHPHIEDKRGSQIQIALTDTSIVGRLFAVLPSETISRLPFHINADFFPSSDRKRIIFDEDYQSEWNRAIMHAATQALSAHFDELKKILGHKPFWKMLEQIVDCREDPVFGVFWQVLAPTFREREIVFTTFNQWQKPDHVHYADSDAEVKAAEILESLGVAIVHPELRSWRNLMVQRDYRIGVALLELDDITHALIHAGLLKPTALINAPESLRTKENWLALWQALNELSKSRPGRQSLEKSLLQLARCAIAPAIDGQVWPPELLRRGAPGTRILFPQVMWLDETEVGVLDLFTKIVADFTPANAIANLELLDPAEIETAWQDRRLDLIALYEWFQTHKDKWFSDADLKRRLRALPIWPSGSGLRPLDKLYILGDFKEDPLNLAELVNMDALNERLDLLTDLGVQKLDFKTYLREQLPPAFAKQPDISLDKRRNIIQLVTTHFGHLADDRSLGRTLGALPLVECDDGEFRPAHQVYTRAEVRAMLGEGAYISISADSPMAKSVLDWLGTQSIPRPIDLVQRLRDLTKAPPTFSTRLTIETIFKFLVEQWPNFDKDVLEGFASIRDIAWLPGRHNPARWHRPKEVYTVFRDYLFETQAEFLAIERELQNQASSIKFAEFLGLRSEPDTHQVVGHLLQCSQQGGSLSSQVYRYLDENRDDPAVDVLINQPCLLLPDGHYALPTRAYWSEHPFGAYRLQLGSEWRDYNRLLGKLGVRDKPEKADYIQVLLEIAQEFEAKKLLALDETTMTVIHRCWQGINNALQENDSDFTEEVKKLRSQRVVPNRKRVLIRPEHTFFEDRPGLAAKFGGFLDDNVIERPQGAWRAMQIAGVRLLGKAVEVRLAEFRDPIEDVALERRLQERLDLIARVVEAERSSFVDISDVSGLATLKFQRAGHLEIQYQIDVFNRRETTQPEPVPAWNYEDDEILVAYSDNNVPWAAVARELAYVLKPVGDIGGLAGGLRYALEPTSLEDAESGLNELGYPRLQQWYAEIQPLSSNVVGIGARDLPASEFVSVTPFPSEVEQPNNGSTYDSGSETEETHRFGTQVSSAEQTGSESSYAIPETVDQDRSGTQPNESAGFSDSGRKPDGGLLESGTTANTSTSLHATDKKQSPSGRSRGKLRSYVVPDNGQEKETANIAAAERRTAVGQAGVKRVMEYERLRRREPKEMDFSNEGYDIESTLVDGRKWFIEVKALSGGWSERNAAGLTSAEFDFARRKRDDYWLYVVEYAIDDTLFRIHRIQNPTHRIDQYLYDDGWQAVAEEVDDEQT